MKKGDKKERLQVKADPEWLARLDEYRRRRPDLPGRSQAIRELVTQALDACDKKKSRE